MQQFPYTIFLTDIQDLHVVAAVVAVDTFATLCTSIKLSIALAGAFLSREFSC